MKKLYTFLLMSLFISGSLFSQMTILVVNDNSYHPERMIPIKTALDNGGYTYDTINAIDHGGSPTFAEMGGYDVVIWYTGDDNSALSFWNGSDSDNQAIKDYIDNGGMFWIQGLDWLRDRYGSAPDNYVAGDFVYDYLGIQEYHAQSYDDDGNAGVPQFDLVAGNGIFTLDPMEWTWSTMWHADALVGVPSSSDLYMMGPAGYAFDTYASSIYYEKVTGAFTGRVISISTETGKFDSQVNLDQYIDEGLTYFDQFVINVIEVTDITVTADASTITTEGGTLQMTADVLPANATNPTVAWSVIDETATATIDNSGLLTSTGTPAGNGTVLVQASAVDGSGITGTYQVTISNQGSSTDFHVLLVNDNNYGATRYLNIETALVSNANNYDIYNTVTTSDAPDIATLNDYEAVIWYTGNDGVGLYLWDETDPNDYKFNEALIQYIDNGGLVWVQGLDFLYDVFSGAPDTFEEGSFVYDYMGIQEYHAQSWGDDGNTGMVQMDVVPDNGIFSITPVSWTYSELHYADALAHTSDAYPLYSMGPAGYMFEDYFCSIFKMNETGMVMLSTVETARIDTQDNTDTYIAEGLDIMEGYLNGDNLVTDIEVSGEGGESTITVDGGNLQILANVLPEFASNRSVSWSVVDGTATASIDENGLLMGTGTPGGNGTVYAKATANDGSGIVDSVMITISMQASGENFNVLLVVDDNTGERYLEIDTALMHGNYNYDIYHSELSGDIPSYTQLNNYQAVIWYTANDGVNLNLWDDSDPNDIKFNAPLIQYIDNGGMVWLQGIDYFYDIYGLAADSFEEGSFIYDYMGIQEYHAQSYADDGNLGMAQMDTIGGNGIFTLNPVEWTYATLWYADALAITPDAQAVYKMGPADYELSDYYCGVYKYHSNGGMVMSFTVETARIDTQENTDQLIDEGLSFFDFYLENGILVSDIDVYSEGDATTITEDAGALQMYADVFPVFAPNREIVWSIVDGTATAYISDEGLVTATGSPSDGNGTVYAKATAADGSGVADSLMITISNQTLPAVPVSDINVTAEGGATTIEIDGGTLQILAEVLPGDASQDSVLWSVVSVTTTATIDAYGILTANSEDNGNGTVYAKATAYDGSGIMDSLLITISNQESDLIPVTHIDVSSESGIVIIDTDGGNLQMLAEVLPENASQDSVLWSVTPGTTTASIDAWGLLTANSEDDGNGFVYAKATAYDGSGITDSLLITISNQESDPIAVTDINVSGEGGVIIIDVDGGTLQMLAEVLPEDATNTAVDWSVIDGTATANIDANGLLQATGAEDGNGTVTVQAAAVDGSGVVGTLEITISNQINDDVLVTEIIVTGEGGAITIETDGGSLQMLAEVIPENATNQIVDWAVIDGTTTATIDANGLLHATGNSDGNGTVTVQATATDGSGIIGTLEITISNQVTDAFQILLVNDNANGTDRYKEIDTILMNLDYDHTIFNTIDEASFPDLSTLEEYNLVIWYTGNDGADLYLWDLTDPDNYQFNAPLKDYVDNGGYVWLQGLDFLYDIYGSAPDSFVEGQFIYDYMGIEEYHAQTYADDGNLGVPQLDVVPDNGVCTFTPIEWAYSTMWYVDAIALASGTNGLYTMGPADYEFSDYYAGFYKVTAPGKIITFTFETAKIDSRSNAEELFFQVIENVDNMVGIHDLTNAVNNIEVYPNPAANLVHFSIQTEGENNLNLQIFNINGQQIINQNLKLNSVGETEIDMTSFESGVYFYRVFGDSFIGSGKIILNK